MSRGHLVDAGLAGPVTAGRVIEWDGDTWRVLSLGARRDGRVYAHLASTTRSRPQRNGFQPIQVADWLPECL